MPIWKYLERTRNWKTVENILETDSYTNTDTTFGNTEMLV